MKGAIITHYYKSKNYGGNLQAFALCKVVNSLGYDVEQISYKNSTTDKASMPRKLYRAVRKCVKKIKSYRIKKDITSRDAKILHFNENVIPHSEKVYDADSIDSCIDNYDFFITGSDQVWNPSAYCPAYGLDFVPSNKIKLSYAASIAREHLDKEYLNILKRNLADYDAISVREVEAAKLLGNITKQKIHITLDPTLLLSQSEWNEICTDRVIKEPYLFCYFLGNDIKHRELAKKIAHENNLKLVTLPHLLGDYRKCDEDFGDIALFEVSPSDFISLIRYSEMVCTDSFHAVAFSCIYEKEFLAFDRILKQSMGSRIRTITNLLCAEEHFCDDENKLSMEYVKSLDKIDYSKSRVLLCEAKEESKKFLKDSLSKSKDC